MNLNRRDFIRSSATAAAVMRAAVAGAAESRRSPGIIDTNVNLFDWPFRRLKYRDTTRLAAKLRKHRVVEAWAGSFEALLSKDMSGTNERLATECRQHGSGLFVPFGSVNIAWPDWEEDLRRCQEVHKMRGIRIYPGYQPFDLNHPAFVQLIKGVQSRGLILQVVFGMEDSRVYHPILEVGPVTFRPLLKAMEAVPEAKMQLLHFSGFAQGDDLSRFLEYPNTSMEFSRLEGNGSVGRMLGTIEGLKSPRVPEDRLCFGSHAPYFPIETAILKLVESPLSTEQLHSLMKGNARRLLSPS
jgi:predicted TIM-barrel fold metal-dependent hydrolase